MQWQAALPYTIPLFIAAALTLVVGLIVWRRRSVPGARPLLALSVAASLWSFAYALELSTVGLPVALVWARVQYLGIMTLPVAWVIFALQYTNHQHWLNQRTMALLLPIPLATQVLVWTNPYHQLIWRRITLDTAGPFPILDYDHGIGFWICNGFAHLCLLFGAVLLLRSFRHAARLYMLQVITFVIGAAAPWLGNALYVLRLSPWRGLDLTPFAFSVTALAVTIGVIWFHFLDIVPIARDSVIESMTDGVIVLDEQNRIADINTAGLHALGMTTRMVIGQPVAQVTARWPQLVARYRAAIDVNEDLVVDLGNQDQRYLNIQITPIYDRQRRLRGRLIVWHNITALKRTEAELRQRNADLLRLQQDLIGAKDAAEAANRAKSSFLANMSHELRTPLSTILGYSELMQLELKQRGDTSFDNHLFAISTAGSQLLGLISSILDLSKIEANQMELDLESFRVADLVDEVERTTRPLVMRNGNTLTIVGASAAGVMFTDQMKVRQVLLNLLSNAAKFTQHGRIRLAISRHPSQAGADEICFVIADTGIGIPSEYLAHLFIEFTQADVSMTRMYGGTGLGLAISQRFCRMLGGEIAIVSELGHGTTCTVRLPAAVRGNALDNGQAARETGA
jgi:PAS domain S-box-containing protein